MAKKAKTRKGRKKAPKKSKHMPLKLLQSNLTRVASAIRRHPDFKSAGYAEQPKPAKPAKPRTSRKTTKKAPVKAQQIHAIVPYRG